MENVEVVLARELEPGEKLIWWSQPRQGIYLQQSDGGCGILGIFLLVFAGVWLSGLKAGTPLPAKLFAGMIGSLVAAGGLHALVGHFFTDAWLRGRTCYGITNRRALIVVTGRTTTLEEVQLRALNETGLEVNSDGTGVIYLGEPRLIERGGGRRAKYVDESLVDRPKFHALPNARGVHSVLLRARDAAQERCRAS